MEGERRKETMQTIRFKKQPDEDGLRIIVLNGVVEYTEHKGVYRVPNYVLELLDKNRIPYETLDYSYTRR
jgi:hypothetical protein